MKSDAPAIWTRRPKIIEPRRELFLRPRIGGFYRLQAIRPDGRVRVDTGFFPNLITDVGLNLIGSSQSWVESVVVGTGNATPTNSDTSLAAQVGSTSNRLSRVGASNQTADRYCYGRAVFRFSAGSAEGNLAEVGVYSSTALFSRALILDGEGVPTTLTILEDEALDVTYEVRNYPPLDDVVTTMDIGETTHDITIRVAEVDSMWDLLGGGLGAPIGWMAGRATFASCSLYPSTSTLGAVTGSPSGTPSNNDGGSDSAYVPNSNARDFSYTFGLTAGNVSGGAAAILVPLGSQPTSGEAQIGMAYQISVDPVIPKNSGNNLALNFRHAWARRSI